MLYFAPAALIVSTAGLSVSAWDLIRHQESLFVHSAHNYFGIALLVAGLTIMIVAQITLFRSYSATLVIREDHKLITHGIYRFMRHPIYTGAIMGLSGIAVYATSMYGFLVLSALIPVFLIRIRLEERLLTEEFGDEYLTYKMAVNKLIPFIY